MEKEKTGANGISKGTWMIYYSPSMARDYVLNEEALQSLLAQQPKTIERTIYQPFEETITTAHTTYKYYYKITADKALILTRSVVEPIEYFQQPILNAKR